MPSLLHEVPIALLRERPEFVAELLRDLLCVAVPPQAVATVLDTDFTEVTPAAYDADLVVALRGERESLAVIVEMQRAIDPRKRYTWPHYAYSLSARLEIPICLIVLTADRAVARWAAEPTEGVIGQPFRPLVLGPDQIPRITSVEEAAAAAELGLLSVLAHDEEPGGEAVIRAVLEGLATLDDPRRTLYSDWLTLASQATRRFLEDQMNKNPRLAYPASEFARTYHGRGRAEGKAEGKAEGQAEGEARGKAEAILTVLAARGLPASDFDRARIRACSDTTQLDRWLTQAVQCAAIGELFADRG